MTQVLRIFSRLNIGGPSLHEIHLSAGLVTHGFKTRLVVGQADEHEGDFLDLARARGVTLEIFPELGRAIRPGNDVRAFFKLYRLIAGRGRPSFTPIPRKPERWGASRHDWHVCQLWFIRITAMFCRVTFIPSSAPSFAEWNKP